MHFHPFSSSDVSLTRSEEKKVGGGGVKNVLCSLVVFETFQSFFFLDFFHVFSFFRETCCTQIQGATMISRWCVFLHLNWINQYHLL